MLSSLIKTSVCSGHAALGAVVPALQHGLYLVSSYSAKAKAPPYVKDASKEAKEAKKPRRAIEVPRALTAYTFYIKEQAKLRVQGSGKSAPHMIKELAAEWKSLSDVQKEPYTQLAAQSKAESASKRAALKEEQALKRPPLTAYNLWCQEIAQELKASSPHLKGPDILREAAARWRALPNGEKQRREAEANAVRDAWKQQRGAC